MTSEKINIRFTNCISRDYTHEELTKEINDLDFLRDAVLYLLNPKLSDEISEEFSDHRPTILRAIRNSFIGTGYNMDYVDLYLTEINTPLETK